MSCSCGKLINQPKGVNPEARIVLEGVAADYYNGKASWTFSNMDKIFGQTAWADHRFVNLECANMVIPDPVIQTSTAKAAYQMWRIRVSTSSQAYNQSRAGGSNKPFLINTSFPLSAENNVTPSRENGDVNDVLFYMVGDNVRQTTGAYTGSEATKGEIGGNIMCVAKENLSQITITIEMYQPNQEVATTPIGGTAGKWVEIYWAANPLSGQKYRTAQFGMVLMAKPVSPENRA